MKLFHNFSFKEDIDVDFGANEGNDGASSASSPQAADFECIEKK